jgi:flagella basal body P-ring formation protein FlgA
MTVVIWILNVAAGMNTPVPCVAVDGPAITAGSLASAVPRFAALPADTVLGFAPQPGVRRVLGPRELNVWLRRFLPESPGVDVTASPCIEARSRTVRREEVEDAVRRAFGSRGREFRIELAAFSAMATGPESLHFDVAQMPRSTDPSGFVIWTGTAGGETGQPRRIWARVRVRERSREPFAGRDLRRGELLREGDVEWREVWRVPGVPVSLPGQLPQDSTWMRSLKQGDSIRASDLKLPQLVRGGDEIELELADGDVHLRLRTTARTSGHSGQRVLVSSPFSKRSIPGVVKAKGYVIAISQ